MFSKGVLRISQNSQESTCAKVSFLIKLQFEASNFIKKRLARVFSFEFCEIFKKTFFLQDLLATGSRRMKSESE